MRTVPLSECAPDQRVFEDPIDPIDLDDEGASDEDYETISLQDVPARECGPGIYRAVRLMSVEMPEAHDLLRDIIQNCQTAAISGAGDMAAGVPQDVKKRLRAALNECAEHMVYVLLQDFCVEVPEGHQP